MSKSPSFPPVDADGRTVHAGRQGAGHAVLRAVYGRQGDCTAPAESLRPGSGAHHITGKGSLSHVKLSKSKR